jgi:hypothetical protein
MCVKDSQWSESLNSADWTTAIIWQEQNSGRDFLPCFAFNEWMMREFDRWCLLRRHQSTEGRYVGTTTTLLLSWFAVMVAFSLTVSCSFVYSECFESSRYCMMVYTVNTELETIPDNRLRLVSSQAQRIKKISKTTTLSSSSSRSFCLLS